MKPALASMALRKKEISDLTRRGLNPILAKNTQYMQRSSVSLVVNLVGLKESVFIFLTKSLKLQLTLVPKKARN
jgi:ribonucleoside-triphosphate reductase